MTGLTYSIQLLNLGASKMDASCISNKVKYESLLFDLDDTLYPLSSGLNLACRRNIEDFMLQQLHIDENIVPSMCLDLYREYGTTMAGLKALGYEFDNDEFHACVHGRLPYEALKPDPLLRNLLLSMPQRKIIFTNADRIHVAQVLKKMGLEDCFEGVICFETLNDRPSIYPLPLDSTLTHQNYYQDQVLRELYDTTGTNDGDDDYNNRNSIPKSPILCKPLVEAIEAAIEIANVDPKKTLFFDDSTRNIASGKAAGLHTVIVGSSKLVPGADYSLISIHNIKEALPEIWTGEQDGEQLEQVIQSTPVETVVLA